MTDQSIPPPLIPTCKAAAILGYSGNKLSDSIQKAMAKMGVYPKWSHGGLKNDKFKLWDEAEIWKFKEQCVPTLEARVVDPDKLLRSSIVRAAIRDLVVQNNTMLRAICKGYNIEPDHLTQEGGQDAGLQEER